MAKVSGNSIQNLSEDWGLDVNTNLPFSGQAVQNFIKSFLRNVTGAAWFDPANYTMYFFANNEDRQAYIADRSQASLVVFSCPMNFSSTMFRVNIVNNNGATQINTATNAGSLSLSTTFTVQTKAITDADWSDTQIGAYVTVAIDRGLTGTFVNITDRILYGAGATIALDVFSELAIGTNRVRFTFEAEDGSVTSSLTYTVTLAEMYVELFNNTWNKPVIASQSDTWYLGGFRIAGAGYKTLHLDIYNSSGTAVVTGLTAAIGTTNAYISSPYFYEILSTSPILNLNTGVYKVRVYVSTDAMESTAIEYNIMFVAASDVSTAQLVVVNSVAEKVYNYSTSVICHFAIYNGNANTGSPIVTFSRMQGSTVISTSEQTLTDIPVQTDRPLEYSVEWGVEGDEYSIGFNIALGTASGSGIVPLDNSTVFPPTAGFDFYMNPASRSNDESSTRRSKIINEVNGAQYAGQWQGVDFIDNIDGHTVDPTGRKCLKIQAGSYMDLPYTEFQMISGDNLTFEICYRITNVSSYSENVITISPNATIAGFRGIRIRPTNITVHSGTDTSSDKDSARGTNVDDEAIIHFVLTINPNFEGRNKLVKGYINGNKNFEFEYSASTDWPVNGPLRIGSSNSDIEVFFIRRYPTALADPMVQANYINSLVTVAERSEVNTAMASVLDAGGTEISYESVKNSGYNFFVVHMEDDGGVPSRANGWSKDTKKKSSLEMHFGQHPEWDWKIENVETMGQGTTSMNYYRWNIRWRIDKSNDSKKVPVSYLSQRRRAGQSYQYDWETASDAKTVRFDGTNHPAVMRITAKINQASSMQSHKMGATRAFTELHDAIGLRNEAQTAADNAGTPRPTVAVYQYPAFGFEYNSRYNTYTFCGLFTIGPDKGDKPTFGFDTVKNTLISLEGTDHNQPLAVFAYPWTNDVNFFYNEEGLAINMGGGAYMTGLEVGNAHGLDTDTAAAQDDVRAVINEQFKPAYLLVWNNSTLIFPVSPSTYGQSTVAETVAYINEHLTSFRGTMYNDRLSYGDMQFWVDGDSSYTLYYYDVVQAKYVTGQSLSAQNGTPSGSTANAKNEWFKTQRRNRFMASAEDYWDIQDALYHFVFCVIFGATDNFAKNSYPYKMELLANNGRFKWRQDDLDTIFDIDNLGGDTKPYYIEFEDAVGGSPYFAGSNSVFWNLIFECYWEDYNNTRGIRTMGKDVIGAMRDLSGASGIYEGFIKYIEKCFWDRAQEYFPPSAYNVDANFKYEQAWLANGQAADPLAQSLGNHLSGESFWVKRRAVYMMSLFKAGPFGDYADATLGTISFRPTSFIANLKPAIWLYPAVAAGQSTPTSFGRTEPGSTASRSFSGDGNTEYYIQGTDFLVSLGDLKGLLLGSGYLSPLNVKGAKLREFIIGSATAAQVTTNVPGLAFSNTACLENIDARNASSISGAVDLSACTRLRHAYFAGTSITSVLITAGSKISALSLPATIRNIMLRQLLHISNSSLTIAGYSNITTILIDRCELDAYPILENAYNDSPSLQYIRAVWKGTYVDDDSSSASVLPAIAAGNYNGLSYEGEALERPYIEGTIRLNGQLYSQDIDKLGIVSETDYGTTLKKALSNLFGTDLFFIYNPTTLLLQFADAAVEAICATNWGDGTGITKAQAEAVTNLTNKFQNNTEIESFDELRYFTGLTILNYYSNTAYGTFVNCTRLKSVVLPETVKTLYATFNGCSNLESVGSLANIETLTNDAFLNCSKLAIDVYMPSLRSISNTAFYNSGITKISSLGYITSLPAQTGNYGVFRNCTSLTEVTLPNTLTTIGQSAFNSCTALVKCDIPSSVTTIGKTAFAGDRNLEIELDLPHLTGQLGANAFYNCQKLSKIRDLGTITAIDGNSINYGTFGNCKSLTEVVLPNTLTSLGMGAFRDCSALSTCSLPSSLTTISNNVFFQCSSLTTLVVNATTPPSLGSAFLTRTSSSLKIYVPYSSDHSILESYKAATNWSSYASIIHELDENGNIPT